MKTVISAILTEIRHRRSTENIIRNQDAAYVRGTSTRMINVPPQ
jgi:hypothetical protein